MENEQVKEVLDILNVIDNDDEELVRLEKASEYFCGTWDLCEGYKKALRLTITDQYENHPDEQDPQDLVKLKAILTENIN